MPELRRDKIRRRWVILAEERLARPNDYLAGEAGKACPFCPGNEAETPPESFALRPPGSPADRPGWRVRVVPNRYPALDGPPGARRGGRIGEIRAGGGAHEVVIEAPEHDLDLATLGLDRLAVVLGVYRDRLRALGRRPGVRYVLLFRNQGRDSGASLAHPHAQILAMPFVPPPVRRELRSLARATGCLFCRLVAEERRAKQRLVWRGGGVAVLAAWDARLPYELVLLPERHEASFARLGDGRLRAVAGALAQALGRLGRRLGPVPFNLVLHDAPIARAGAPAGPWHWHLEIVPRLAGLGGYELGTGLHINPLPPEEAARHLRPAPAVSRRSRSRRP